MNNMVLKKIKADSPDLPVLKKLYEEAFPEGERPLGIDDFFAYQNQLPVEILGIYPDEAPGSFAGFFLILENESFVYLLFFAVCPDKRSSGIGGKAIIALREYCGNKQLTFSYESTFQESDNAEQRERRRSFYLKNGFYETGWFAKLGATEFIIASSQKEFDKDNFIKRLDKFCNRLY